MITLFTGENSFEITRATQRLEAELSITPERFDGRELTLAQLPDLLLGITLFNPKRFVIIKNLSENKPVWAALEQWLARMNDQTDLLLIEPAPDKRTKTYKALQKKAHLTDFPLWTERDTAKAEAWAIIEAKQLGFTLDKKSARALIMRVGVDQWQLYHALEKLAVVDEVNSAVIEDTIEANPTENVFYVFEAALKGNSVKVKKMLEVLAMSEDPYRLFGLLSTQALQLATLIAAQKPTAQVASDIGAHPFVLSKLAPYAQPADRVKAKKIITAFSRADAALKTSGTDPWLLIERALLEVASL